MTLIPLNYKNFVKNKIKNTIKVNYINTDNLTWEYDQNINSKSLLNSDYFSDITDEECNLDSQDANLENKKSNIKSFLSFIQDDQLQISDYFQKKDQIIHSNSLTNDNLKSFNFRNRYKIERINQKFLPQSFELQKKNYVKNNLYKDYRENYSLDYYNELNFGFCNWNTINFFSQKFENNLHHSNCIIWPNPKNDNNKNNYNFINNSFNFSCYLNLRKNYSNYENPECLIHIPDRLSIYIIKSYDTETHRIGIILGQNSRKKLTSFEALNFQSTSRQTIKSEGVHVTSDLNIINNTWYNLSFNHYLNSDNSVNIEIYVDGQILDSVLLDQTKEFGFTDSYICLGNKPEYQDSVNYNHIFHQFFSRSFDKDISLGSNNIFVKDLNIDVNDVSYLGNVTFENNNNLSAESFHGEIHDIRFYSEVLTEEKILFNKENSISSLQEEINNHSLSFYVPVFYIPSYSKRKGPINGSGDKLNLRYACIYNPFLANACGGLEVSVENYLIDFVNQSKPNVVIGGKQSSFVWEDFTANSISSLTSSTSDISDIKTGETLQSIYNKNLVNDPTNNLNNNLSYRNLFILPNDNGIQKVFFSLINEFVNNYQEKYDANKINLEKNYNISIEDISLSSNYNNSWSFDDTKSNNMPNIIDNNLDSFTISKNNINSEFNLTNDVLFNLSNIIFHDDRITDITNIKNSIDNSFKNKYLRCKEIYPLIESNPVLRNYKQETEELYLSSDNVYHTEKLEYSDDVISYLKLPIPYSVINKDYDSLFISIFDVSSKLYNKKINKNSFSITDTNIYTTNNNVTLSFYENKKGLVYRKDCLSKVADWNYVGHIFYKEGIVSLNRPELIYFGQENFTCSFETDFSMFVHEINIPVDKGYFDSSLNNTYNADLRQDESAFNSEEKFVYITDINLHDENLNIVAKAKLARPAPKKKSDAILFRLKMDY